jgi:hypothetical protein
MGMTAVSIAIQMRVRPLGFNRRVRLASARIAPVRGNGPAIRPVHDRGLKDLAESDARMQAQSSTSRLHYLDAMRSVLMLLGVVLHSARPYDSREWQVKDVDTLPMLDGLVEAIHLFRMPAFFVVAGYFAMFLVLRQPTVHSCGSGCAGCWFRCWRRW